MTGQTWFKEDLSAWKIAGKPMLTERTSTLVRPSLPQEVARAEVARLTEENRGYDTAFTFAFLVLIDPDIN